MKRLLEKISKTIHIEIFCRYFYCKIIEAIMKYFYNTLGKKENYTTKKFRKKLGYEIDFSKSPETFNQKIQFRKLYDKNPLYPICADKYRVREYVKEKIGKKYLIPLHLVTNKLTTEQWEKLPNSFVAKANHNSGPVQVVKDKAKVKAKEVIKELHNQLKIDYGVYSLQPHYSDIPRKIIVEEFIGDKNKIPDDYKFHVFNNSNETSIFIEYITGREVNDLGRYSRSYYDESWNKQEFNSEIKENIPRPKNLDKMLILAKKLAEDFDYVRVDLYDIDGDIYFGELTFTHSNGFSPFTNDGDFILGSYWKQQVFK